MILGEWILYRVYTSGKQPESASREKKKKNQKKSKEEREVEDTKSNESKETTPAVRISIAPRHQTMQKQHQLHVRVCVLYVLVQTHRVPTTSR
ncbi:uncharacterized protein BO80DRAFT_170414 [Aspergillus ibericus CBS 121593]|uniref:Uncharacterized protein n=1 Tax=Aspergillus ibericus CBS 121593 TaxID=1448316 RepID=A0A395HFF2_9EURO|nr:hypothetical protein BO80DRAFT_170414 [Aspergillus ibericus CBS 121593]RAL04954.1 hypothetical protein BO80DRAFT_170414 [Aspergillus ibericus CBS 121593]